MMFYCVGDVQLWIMQILQRDGKVLVSELSKDLQVSEDTIRRDLRELAGAGVLQRVHGGALPRSPATASFTARQQQAPGAKAAGSWNSYQSGLIAAPCAPRPSGPAWAGSQPSLPERRFHFDSV